MICAVHMKNLANELHTMMLSLPPLADASSQDTARAARRARAPLPESFMFVVVVAFAVLIAVVYCYCNCT